MGKGTHQPSSADELLQSDPNVRVGPIIEVNVTDPEQREALERVHRATNLEGDSPGCPEAHRARREPLPARHARPDDDHLRRSRGAVSAQPAVTSRTHDASGTFARSIRT